PASRLNDVERSIRMIDQQICRALGVSVPTNNATTRTVYYPQGMPAGALLAAVAGAAMDPRNPNHAHIANVDLTAMPPSSISSQAIIVSGRENEVAQIMEDFASLDTVSNNDGECLIYDVKFLDPRALREELVTPVPGLTVSVPPAAAANSQIFKPNQAKAQAS